MFDEFYHRSIWSIILLAVTRLWSIPSCWKRWPWSHSAFQRWSNKVIDSTAFGKFNTTKIPNNKELVVPIFHRSQTLYIRNATIVLWWGCLSYCKAHVDQSWQAVIRFRRPVKKRLLVIREPRSDLVDFFHPQDPPWCPPQIDVHRNCQLYDSQKPTDLSRAHGWS